MQQEADKSHWRKPIQISTKQEDRELIDEVVIRTLNADGHQSFGGPMRHYSRLGRLSPHRARSAVILDVMRRELERLKKQEAELEAQAAAGTKPVKPTAANRVPIDGQLGLPIFKPKRGRSRA